MARSQLYGKRPRQTLVLSAMRVDEAAIATCIHCPALMEVLLCGWSSQDMQGGNEQQHNTAQMILRQSRCIACRFTTQ